jgi:hypothetical protein
VIRPHVAVLDRFARGYPKHADGEPATYGPLAAALETEFSWDAHLVAYRVPAIPRRLGMNNAREGSGLTIWDRMPAGGITMVLHVVDVDAKLVGGEMSAAWWAVERAKVERAHADMPGYAYTTRGGYRLVWWIDPFVIATPLDHERWKQLYLARLDHLRDRYGIVGDRACKDFPRHYRLPRVVREPSERTALTLREVGEPRAIATWSAEVRPAPARPPFAFDADVPEPTWPDEVELGAATERLRDYARRQRASSEPRAARRADLVRRILNRAPIVDAANLGVAGLGRDNSVYEAANLIAWICPDIGPHGAVALLSMSVARMDCDSHGGKGRDAYLDKAATVYADGVRKLHQAREQGRREGEDQRARLMRALFGGGS